MYKCLWNVAHPWTMDGGQFGQKPAPQTLHFSHYTCNCNLWKQKFGLTMFLTCTTCTIIYHPHSFTISWIFHFIYFFLLFQELALLFEELDEDGDGQVSFNEFLHGLFAAKDFQQSDIEPEWEQQQQSTPYNQAPPTNFTTKVRVCQEIRIMSVVHDLQFTAVAWIGMSLLLYSIYLPCFWVGNFFGHGVMSFLSNLMLSV